MKKLLSGLLTVVMFVSIITSVLLFSIRGMISSNNIEKMYDTFAEEGVIEELIGFDSSEFEEVLDDKEYKKMLADLTSEFVKYTLFITDETPDIEPLLDYLKEEDDSLSDAEIEEMIEEFEEEIENERESINDDETTDVIKTLFSNSVLFGSIAITIACIFVIYVLSKDIKKTVRKVAVIDVLTGILIVVSGTALVEAMKQEAGAPVEVVEALFGTFKTNGIISFGRPIMLLIGAIILFNKYNSFASLNMLTAIIIAKRYGNMFKQTFRPSFAPSINHSYTFFPFIIP